MDEELKSDSYNEQHKLHRLDLTEDNSSNWDDNFLAADEAEENYRTEFSPYAEIDAKVRVINCDTHQIPVSIIWHNKEGSKLKVLNEIIENPLKNDQGINKFSQLSTQFNNGADLGEKLSNGQSVDENETTNWDTVTTDIDAHRYLTLANGEANNIQSDKEDETIELDTGTGKDREAWSTALYGAEVAQTLPCGYADGFTTVYESLASYSPPGSSIDVYIPYGCTEEDETFELETAEDKEEWFTALYECEEEETSLSGLVEGLTSDYETPAGSSIDVYIPQGCREEESWEEGMDVSSISLNNEQELFKQAYLASEYFSAGAAESLSGPPKKKRKLNY